MIKVLYLRLAINVPILETIILPSWDQLIIDTVNHQIREIEKQLDDEIKGNPVWHENDQLIQSVPGVGPKTSRILLNALPELGKLNGKQIAPL